VDDGDVVREPVRGVERLLVAAQRDAPRSRSGGDDLQYAVAHGIDAHYSVPASGRGVEAFAIAGQRDADGMIDRPQLETCGDAARGEVENVHGAGDLASDVRARVVGREDHAARTGVDHDVG